MKEIWRIGNRFRCTIFCGDKKLTTQVEDLETSLNKSETFAIPYDATKIGVNEEELYYAEFLSLRMAEDLKFESMLRGR